MQGYRIDGLGDNVQIDSIGSFFRRLNQNQWAVNLTFSPEQQRKSQTLSKAPILVYRRKLNLTEPVRIAGYRKSFRVSETSRWTEAKVGSYPSFRKLRLNQHQNCFMFFIADGTRVFMPQYELARVLFLRDAYLSRSALQHGVLDLEFDVQSSNGSTFIEVQEHSSYGVTHFEDPDCRRVLSWILLDPAARSSFESIAQRELKEGVESSGYRFWDFAFDPPPLQGASFEVTGHFDRERNAYFVFEILGLRGIPVSMPLVIEMHHPKHEQKVRSNGRSGAVQSGLAAQLNVLDGIEAGLSDARLRIDTERTVVQFDTAFIVHRSSDKKRIAVGGKECTDKPTEATRDVSVDDSSLSGDLPGAEWNGFDDQTDDEHLFLGRFKAFWDMVDMLEEQDGIKCNHRVLRKLPELPRCKKHLLSSDGSNRCMAVIEFEYRNCDFVLLEVDTSDADKQLSTRLLRLQQGTLSEGPLIELERELLKRSLSWPVKLLDSICGKNQHCWIPHPRSKHKGVLEPDCIFDWAIRVHGWVQSFN